MIHPIGKFERFHFIKILFCRWKIAKLNKEIRDYENNVLRYDGRREQYHEAVREEQSGNNY